MNESAKLLISAFVLLSVAALNVSAQIYNLPENSNHDDFQILIDNAHAGDIILLKSGIHYLNDAVRINREKTDITIKGEKEAVVLKKDSNVAAFEVRGNNIIFENFELDGNKCPQVGILLYGANNKVVSCKLHDCGDAGILIHNLGDTAIPCTGNSIEKCNVYHNHGVGISQHGHTKGLISENVIKDNYREGITIDCGSHYNIVKNNTIVSNNGDSQGAGGCGGIGIDQADNNIIEDNIIMNTKYCSGITFNNEVGGCDNNSVIGNQINDNEGYGILSKESKYKTTNLKLEDNFFSNNKMSPPDYFIENNRI